ncbi:hypothetical protein [Paenibacillus lautus]|uniref:hypothetical protein n=1 Tax=Paenibacillus lautus TaxID=1401 RepID=UPI000BBDBA9A|nr:hypothetical protein [Paenibacillus lautus]PCL91540.1 hypothetical protein CPZ30_19685 [Paenibacillus lautus]
MYNSHQTQKSQTELLLHLYQTVMENPSFDLYSQHEEEFSCLYEELSHITMTKDDLRVLAEVQKLHEQLVHVIFEETNVLNEEIVVLEKKKKISDHYGRQSNNYNVGAFFVDYRK